jgi:dipeptidyl aminopeptidase/acylaminoacyl peptidase
MILFGGPAYAPMKPFLGVQVFRASSTPGSCRRILAAAPEDAGGIQLTRDGHYAVIKLSGSTTPGNVIVGTRFVDLRSGKSWTIPHVYGVASPNGALLAAVGYDNKLVVMRNDGAGSRVIADTNGELYTDLAFSPDARWIAFTVSTGGGRDGPELRSRLEVVNLADGARHPIYTEPDPYSYRPEPTWSPNGKLLYIGGVRQPVVIGRDGSNRRLLPNRGEGAPIFSPDGRKMLFTGPGRYKVGDVYVANIDGSKPHALTTTKPPPVGEEQRGSYAFAWSPDGRQILYLRRFTLSVMNADGTGSRTICTPPRGTYQSVIWTK